MREAGASPGRLLSVAALAIVGLLLLLHSTKLSLKPVERQARRTAGGARRTALRATRRCPLTDHPRDFCAQPGKLHVLVTARPAPAAPRAVPPR